MDYTQIYNKLCARGKEKRDTNPMWGRWERHHITPRHVGGNNERRNLTLLQHKEHTLAHNLLYRIYGRIEDKVASRMMKGILKDWWNDPEYAQIMKEKVKQNLLLVNRQTQIEASRKAGLKQKEEHKGIHNKEVLDKAIKANKQWVLDNPDLAKERSAKSHLNRTREDYLRMAATKSKHFIISPTGENFGSVAEASEKYNIEKYKIDNWSRRNQKGWTRISKHV